MTKIQAIVTDIEGTTTSISFVKDTLFPYVLEHIQEFLEAHWSNPDLQKCIVDLREQSVKELNQVSGTVEVLDPNTRNESEVKQSVISNIKWQMSLDRKVAPLKNLQGLMWKLGYESGALLGEVYDDVLPVLESWNSQNIPVYIYSSGSIAAQKLLFGYTKHGSLLKHFKGHFDTTTGSKLESKSYEIIAKEIGFENSPSSVLFLSDNILEIQAAHQAGLSTYVAIRPGNAPINSEELEKYKHFTSFDQIKL